MQFLCDIILEEVVNPFPGTPGERKKRGRARKKLDN